jgi:hypothetical protein
VEEFLSTNFVEFGQVRVQLVGVELEPLEEWDQFDETLVHQEQHV